MTAGPASASLRSCRVRSAFCAAFGVRVRGMPWRRERGASTCGRGRSFGCQTRARRKRASPWGARRPASRPPKRANSPRPAPSGQLRPAAAPSEAGSGAPPPGRAHGSSRFGSPRCVARSVGVLTCVGVPDCVCSILVALRCVALRSGFASTCLRLDLRWRFGCVLSCVCGNVSGRLGVCAAAFRKAFQTAALACRVPGPPSPVVVACERAVGLSLLALGAVGCVGRAAHETGTMVMRAGLRWPALPCCVLYALPSLTPSMRAAAPRRELHFT